MEKITDNILRKVEKARMKKGMTKTELSLKMEKSPQWFVKLRQDNRDLKVSDMVKLSEVLEVNPSSFLPNGMSMNICDMNVEELIKMIAREECKRFLENNYHKITKVLEHIGKFEDIEG